MKTSISLKNNSISKRFNLLPKYRIFKLCFKSGSFPYLLLRNRLKVEIVLKMQKRDLNVRILFKFLP